MFAFLLCIIGIVVTGGGLVIVSPYRNLIVYGVIACLCVSYAYFFFFRHRDLRTNSAEKCLLCFIAIGLLHVLLSYAGVNRLFPDLVVYFDKSFILRQAVYLLTLPVIFLFRDEFYAKGKEWLISHYGELLFWVLYAATMLENRFTMLATSQLVLCWLALRVKSPQWWRNALRYAAVLLTPFSRDGVSTMLILRALFLVILIIPKGCKREGLKWTAIGLLFILIAVSFIAPLVISDTSFITDHNTRWRMDYWKDALQNLGNSYGLGIGYGTSYPSKPFALVTRDFYSTNLYSWLERTFVLACHNSLVSVAMRTGIFGIGAFGLMFILMLWELLKYRIPASGASFFALLGAIVIITFNVGLESPNYMFAFLFCMGECNLEITRIRRKCLGAAS